MMPASLPLLRWIVVLVNVLLAATILLAGCGGTYHVNTDILDDGTTVVVMSNNEVIKIAAATSYSTGSFRDDYIVEKQCFLDLRKTTDSSGNVSYAFMLKYVGSDWLKIEKGLSLELIVDGKSFSFSGEGEIGREKDPSGRPVSEWLDYPVESDFLIRLTRARNVEMVVNGHEGEISGQFDEDNFKNIRRFVVEYVQNDGQEPPS